MPKRPPSDATQDSGSDFKLENPSPKAEKKPRPSQPISSTQDDSQVQNASSKAKLALMIIECGIKNLPKAEAQSQTGLNAQQQKDMLRKGGKGSVRNALTGAALAL